MYRNTVEVKPEQQEKPNRMVKTGTFTQATVMLSPTLLPLFAVQWELFWVAFTGHLLICLFLHAFNSPVLSTLYVSRAIMVTVPIS